MKGIIITGLAISVLVTFYSCGSKGVPETKNEEASIGTSEDHGIENTTTLTGEQVKSVSIEFGSVEKKELTNSIKANGILAVPNQNKAFVTPLYSGVIKSLNVQAGSFVKRGQTVATIVNPELLQMQQELEQVNAQIALSEAEVKRQKELVEGNAAPLKKLQQAQTELETLLSRRNGLEKQLSAVGASHVFSSTIAIKAPIGGAISKVNAQLGSNVDVNTPIAEIVDNSLLHLDLYVYEKDLPKLKDNQKIHFTITNNAGREYDAEIFSIGTAFEANSKTIPVHARVIGDKSGLIDGMNVTALVSLDKSTVPAVPSDAIVNYQGKDYIFMVTDAANSNQPTRDSIESSGKSGGFAFERIPVAKGTTDVGYSEITLLKDIPPNARIVTKGAFFILAKMTNTEGHDEH